MAYSYDSISGGTNTLGHLTQEQTTQNGSALSQRLLTAYDAIGRLAGETDVLPIGSAQTSNPWTYTYNLAGDLSSSKSSNAMIPFQASYTYDANGRVHTVPFQTFASLGGSAALSETLLNVTAYARGAESHPLRWQ